MVYDLCGNAEMSPEPWKNKQDMAPKLYALNENSRYEVGD